MSVVYSLFESVVEAVVEVAVEDEVVAVEDAEGDVVAVA